MLLPIVSLATWIYLLLLHGRFWLVRDESEAVGEALPCRVAAVIPARDEAETIGCAVASLARQDFAGALRVFVVDDGSTDGTADRARGAATGVTVIEGLPLPPGWTGKMWAVSQGLERALGDNPEYVLLTDADIEHSAGNLRSLVARAQRDNLDLVSYMVRLENRTFAERCAIPAFVFFFLKLYPPARVASQRSATAGAAGGCMLVRAEALRRIGGVERIRGEIIDDCALARQLKATGGHIWLGLTAKTRSLRSYRGFGEIAHMIARTAFTQLGHSLPMLIGTVAGMLVLYVVGPAMALQGNPWATAAWLLMSAAYIPMLRFYGQSPLWAPALPVVAVFYTGATVWSAIRYWTGRGGSWKGRAQAAKTY